MVFARVMVMVSILMIFVRAGRAMVIAYDIKDVEPMGRRMPSFFHRVRHTIQSIGGQVEKQCHRNDERNKKFVF